MVHVLDSCTRKKWYGEGEKLSLDGVVHKEYTDMVKGL